MEYRIRAMELWFQHLPGSLLLDIETQAVSKYMSHRSGDHCLQIGGPSDLSLIQKVHFSHKIFLSTQRMSAFQTPRIQSALEALPLITGSIDHVVLAHLLEFANSPQDVLEEVHRVLAPEGQLLLLAFNSWSLWGITRMKHGRRGFPWSGKFFSIHQLRSLLSTVGYSIVTSKTLCFRPAFYDIHRSQRWKFLETVGACFFPNFGAVSFIVAQKKERAMTPIIVKEKVRPVKVGAQVIETRVKG